MGGDTRLALCLHTLLAKLLFDTSTSLFLIFLSRASQTALQQVQPSLLAASLRLVMLPTSRPSQTPLTAAGGRLLQQLAAVAATATSRHHESPPTPSSHDPVSENGCSDSPSEAVGQALAALLHSLQIQIAAAGANPSQHTHSPEQHSDSTSHDQASCRVSGSDPGGEEGDAASTATMCAQLTALLCASAYVPQPAATQGAAGTHPEVETETAFVGPNSESSHPPAGIRSHASPHELRSLLLLCVHQWLQPHRPAGVRLAVLGALKGLMQVRYKFSHFDCKCKSL